MRPLPSFLITLVIVLFGLTGCAGGGDETASVRVAILQAVATQGLEPLVDQLREGGFVPGENLEFVQDDPFGETYPDAEGAEAAVREWVDAGVDLIFAFSSSGAAVAAGVTAEVPILFLVNDPTAVGLVDDENAPSGNLTGATFRVPGDRTLEIAGRGIPGLAHVGVLVPRDDPASVPARDALVGAARDAGLAVTIEVFASEDDVERAVTALADAEVGAVLVANTPTSVRLSQAIERFATGGGIPIVANTSFTQGATFVLEPDTDEVLAQLGRQAVRLLEGATPAEVPVQNPRHFRIVLDAAKAAELGLPPFPDDLVRQADEVVE